MPIVIASGAKQSHCFRNRDCFVALLLAMTMLGAGRSYAFEIFPNTPLLAPLIADPLEPQNGGHQVQQSDGSEWAEVQFSKIVYLARWDQAASLPVRLQLGAGGSVLGRFQFPKGPHRFRNADIQVRVPLELAPLQAATWTARFSYIHRSSHLGDFFIQNSTRTSNDFSREIFQALGAWTPVDGARLYAGVAAQFGSKPRVKTTVGLAGYEFWSPWLGKSALRMYVAGHHEWQAEFADTLDTSVQVGIAYQPDLARTRLRFAYTYFHGHSPSGQFFDEIEESYGFAAYVDF